MSWKWVNCFLLLSQSSTDLLSHATVRVPVVKLSFNRYHIVSRRPYRLAALILNVLWSPMFPGVSIDPLIQFVSFALSIIQVHVPHWFWKDQLDTASAVPIVIASLIFDVSPLMFNWSCYSVPSVVCSSLVYHDIGAVGVLVLFVPIPISSTFIPFGATNAICSSWFWHNVCHHLASTMECLWPGLSWIHTVMSNVLIHSMI